MRVQNNAIFQTVYVLVYIEIDIRYISIFYNR